MTERRAPSLDLQEGEGIRTAVDVFITDKSGKNVLLGLRKASAGKGTWSLIGGHQKTGERIHDTALREIREEVGEQCVVNVHDDVLAVRENRIPPWYVPHVTVIIKGMHVGGEAVNNRTEENSSVRWFPIDALPENLFSGVGDIVEVYRNKTPRVVTDWQDKPE